MCVMCVIARRTSRHTHFPFRKINWFRHVRAPNSHHGFKRIAYERRLLCSHIVVVDVWCCADAVCPGVESPEAANGELAGVDDACDYLQTQIPCTNAACATRAANIYTINVISQARNQNTRKKTN